MPRNPASPSSAASSSPASAPSPARAVRPPAAGPAKHSPNPSLFTRLRQLLTGADADTPARIEEAIAELARAHAGAAQEAREARAAHERAVLQGLAEEDAAALDASRAQAAAAAAHEAELSTALAHLQQRLARVREAAARARWDARWQHAQELMEARSEAMARLQAASDLYAQTLQEAVAASEAVWAALPVLPAHRPATYGRDLYARANLYLYGATDGKCGSAGLSPHAARQRPGLLDLDDGAREILLLPLTAAQADEAIARAARPIHPGGEDPARLPGA